MFMLSILFSSVSLLCFDHACYLLLIILPLSQFSANHDKFGNKIAIIIWTRAIGNCVHWPLFFLKFQCIVRYCLRVIDQYMMSDSLLQYNRLENVSDTQSVPFKRTSTLLLFPHLQHCRQWRKTSATVGGQQLAPTRRQEHPVGRGNPWGGVRSQPPHPLRDQGFLQLRTHPRQRLVPDNRQGHRWREGDLTQALGRCQPMENHFVSQFLEYCQTKMKANPCPLSPLFLLYFLLPRWPCKKKERHAIITI